MARDKKRIVAYRRKRAQRTNYRLRLQLLQSRKTRLVIRHSNKHVIAQLINYAADGDTVITTASTQHLQKLGWTAACNNIPAAYLVGLLLAKKAKEKNITTAIVDLGMQVSKKGNRLYAVIKGAQDGGLELTCPETMLPSKERLEGQHIKAYAEKAQQYKKTKDAALNINELIKKVKTQLM